MKKQLFVCIFTLALGSGFHLTAMDIPEKEQLKEEAPITEELFKIVRSPNIDADALETVKSLIDRGADVNAEGSKRITPLHEAAFNGHTDVCNLLIERGASLEAINKYGNTPLHFAVMGNHPQTAKLLIERGADLGSTPLRLAVIMGLVEITKLLIEKGANLEAINDDGNTALHDAVIMMGGGETAKILIEGGADVEAKNGVGRTPLHLAANDGRNESCKLLIEMGANPYAMDAEGMTPLAGAAWSRRAGPQTCELLLKYMLIQPIMKCGTAAECRARLSALRLRLKGMRVAKDMSGFIMRSSPELENELLYVLYDDYIHGRKMTSSYRNFLMTRLPQVVSSPDNLNAVRNAMRVALPHIRPASWKGQFEPELRALLDPATLTERIPEILFENPASQVSPPEAL